jgi:hypothetical protein
MNVLGVIISITVCILANLFSSLYNVKSSRKRTMLSGIILTVGGLVYSTIQTQFIIKQISKKINKLA